MTAAVRDHGLRGASCVRALCCCDRALHPPPPAAEIDPQLIARAKKEGQLTYYTDLIVEQVVRPLVAAFEKKYGIKVTLHARRQPGQFGQGPQRVPRRARAVRRVRADLGLPCAGRRRRGAAVHHRQRRRAAAAIPRSQPLLGRHACLRDDARRSTPRWCRRRSGRRPTTICSLPYWKDKMVWKPNDMSGATGFVGNVLLSMGEERGMDYLRRLAKQNIKMVNASARAILDQVIGGEYAMSLQIFNHHAAISAKKGAPVDWVRLNPVHRQSRAWSALTRNSPASECRAAVRRVPDLAGGPGDLPEGELPAGAAGRAADDPRAHSGARRLHGHRHHARDPGQASRPLGQGGATELFR